MEKQARIFSKVNFQDNKCLKKVTTKYFHCYFMYFWD